jgi:hypothetical protein
MYTDIYTDIYIYTHKPIQTQIYIYIYIYIYVYMYIYVQYYRFSRIKKLSPPRGFQIFCHKKKLSAKNASKFRKMPFLQ